MNKYIEIKGDINDADYITQRTKITDAQIEEIEPVIEAIKNCKADHNWPSSEYSRDPSPHELYVETGLISQSQLNLFDGFVPHGEYGIHTIESIKILVVSEEIDLL